MTTTDAEKAETENIEPARLLQRVWRGLKDGDCLNCNTLSAMPFYTGHGGMQCPNCKFTITGEEIAEIKRMYAGPRLHAVTAFKAWQESRKVGQADGV